MPHKNFHSYRYAPLYVRSALSEILFQSVKKWKYHQNRLLIKHSGIFSKLSLWNIHQSGITREIKGISLLLDCKIFDRPISSNLLSKDIVALI